MGDYYKEDFIDFNSIKKRIKEFKLEKTFDENIYLEILNDLDKLYDLKSQQFIQKWNKKDDVLKEKENFTKYLINNIFIIANQNAKSKNYKLSLAKIEQLGKLMKPSDYQLNNDIDKLKQYCEIQINLIDGNNLLEKKKYKEAIKFFKNVIELSSNPKHNDIYTKKLTDAKLLYIKNVLEENINLLQLNNYEQIIDKCEQLLKEFQYESKLKSLIFQTKIMYNGS